MTKGDMLTIIAIRLWKKGDKTEDQVVAAVKEFADLPYEKLCEVFKQFWP